MTSGGDKKTLLLADDHPLVLWGIRDLLAQEPDLEVVATCPDGATALERLRSLTPDVAVLDVTMPGMGGIAVLSAIRKDRSGPRVVLLTASISDGEVLDAIAADVDGLVLKDCAPDDLIRCIRAVLQGRRWLPRQMVTGAIRRETDRRQRGETLATALTLRERDVAVRVAHGFSNKRIARELDVSEGTVKIHLHNIYQKLGLQNRTELATLAMRHADALAAKGGDQRD
jgi:two-component system, NarL family, nitrate/nitrite response regulator NarL